MSSRSPTKCHSSACCVNRESSTGIAALRVRSSGAPTRSPLTGGCGASPLATGTCWWLRGARGAVLQESEGVPFENPESQNRAKHTKNTPTRKMRKSPAVRYF